MAINRYRKLKNRKIAPIQLPKLAARANKYHNRAEKYYRGFLESARKSGEALIKARYLMPSYKVSVWKKWLEKNFHASYETAKVYVRIAKKWNDPRLIEARRLGVTLDSINKVLEILSGKRKTDGELDKPPTEEQYYRYEIIGLFMDKIKTELSLVDLVTLRNSESEVFEELWDKIYDIIRDTVCGILQHDPYEYEPKDSQFYKRFLEDEKRDKERILRIRKALDGRMTA